MALTGNELVEVVGVSAAGVPAGKTFSTTTQQIANLGGSTSTPTVYTGQQNFSNGALTDGTSIAWNLNTKQSTSVTLTGSHTLANPTNMVEYGTYALIVKQDGSGGHTLAFGSSYKFPSGIAPVVASGANDVSIITFVSDGTNMYGVGQVDFS